MKHLNILVFLLLSALVTLFYSNVKISTNFMDALFSKESTEVYKISQELGSSNNILVSTKGFDESALSKLYKIKDDLEKLDTIEKAQVSILPSKKVKEYLAQHYYVMANFKDKKFTQNEIKTKLQKIYDEISNSMFYTPINENDPMDLFSLDVMPSERYLKLKDYGYILKATTKVKVSNTNEAKKIYDQINSIVEKYPNTISFAPFYFLVENSAYIQEDATNIILISSVLLLLLYFVILRNIKLFFHTIITLGSSAMLALLVSTLVFDQINILALVFGISITTISIDYMFHYYFHNQYQTKGFIIQKKVFFGFFTTFSVFLIFSFIDIELFSQLSLFSAISLLSAYILFSMAFGYLDIKPAKVESKKQNIKSFNPLAITLISSIMLVYASLNLEFDTDLKNLDYQNEKLKKISQKFSSSLNTSSYQNILISGSTKDQLLQNYEQALKEYPSMMGIGNFVYSNKKCNKKLETLNNYNFKQLNKDINKAAKQIGFNDTFLNVYLNVKNTKCDMVYLDELDFKVAKIDDKYYTLAIVDKDQNISENKNLSVLDMNKTISKNLNELKTTLLFFIMLSVLFIIASLIFISKTKFLYPLSYILFPLSVVLFTLSFYSPLNLMHMFSLIILIAIGIDYGIYMLDTSTRSQTTKAIRYAMLSTFAGFGVLIFSSVNSLHSIGYVISVGIISIFILLILKGKR